MFPRQAVRGLTALGMCLTALVLMPGLANADERSASGNDTVARMALTYYAGSSAYAGQGPSARSAGLCDKTLWKSGRIKKTRLTGRMTKAIEIANKVDSVATYVSLVTGIIGSPASGAVVKLVAKLGKGGVVKVLKSTLKKVRKIPVKKGGKIGVKIRTKCKYVFIYPTIAAYT